LATLLSEDNCLIDKIIGEIVLFLVEERIIKCDTP